MPTSTLNPPVAAAESLPAPVTDAPGTQTSAPAHAGPSDRTRFNVLCASHAVIDIFPIFFTTLAWALQDRLGLTNAQYAWLFIATPIFSGLTQPLFAWLTDKHDTRLCGPIGMVVGATCIASIGLAQNFWQLAVLQAIGVMATGMYHPITTAVAGQIGTRFLHNGRGQAIGLFIAAGMVGQACGPRIAAWINHFNGGTGMPWLVVLIPPSILAAGVLHAYTRRLPHRHANHHELRASVSRAESRRRWRVICLLTAQNSLRFTTNVGLFAMFNVWAMSKLLATPFESETARAAAASALTSELASGLTIGMGLTVVLGGRIVRRGAERTPLFLYSILGAIGCASMGYLGDWAVTAAGRPVWWALIPMHLAGWLSTMGFFATFPIATSLAQRLQPGHTGVVTSLMMGVGWGISAAAAPAAVLFFGNVPLALAPTLEPWRINMGFLGFAALLLVAGALTLFVPKDLVEKAAEHH